MNLILVFLRLFYYYYHILFPNLKMRFFFLNFQHLSHYIKLNLNFNLTIFLLYMIHFFLKFYSELFQVRLDFRRIHILLFLVLMFGLLVYYNFPLLNFIYNLLCIYFHIFFYLHNMVLFFLDI